MDHGKDAPEAVVVPARGGPRAVAFAQALNHNLVLVTGALLILLYLCNALLVTRFYGTAAARETETREAAATLLAEHASRAVSAVEFALESIREKLPPDFAIQPPSIFTQLMLDERIRGLPQVRAIIILDAAGQVIYDSRHFPSARRDLHDRTYFTEQKKWRGVGLYIDVSETARYDHQPFFGISLPLLDSVGGFRGVVTALADPRYFAHTYDGAPGLNPDMVVLLSRTDGAVLASTIAPRQGLPPPQHEADALAHRPKSGISARPVPSFPLRVVLSGPSPAESATFRSFFLTDIGIIIAVTAVALWLAYILTGEARARNRAESRLRDAIESVPAAFILFDADDRLLLYNERYRMTVPPSLQATLRPGIPFSELLHAITETPEFRTQADETAEQYIERRLRMHGEASGEYVHRLPGGPWVLTREHRTNEGGLVICHTDISGMKEQEEALRRSERAERAARQHAERADRTKSAFLATMSHELRTPLNAVIGFSEIIEQEMFGPVPLRYREYNGLILSSGRHLLAVINDILDIAKLQSGKTELHLAPLPVGDLVEDTLRIMREQAESQGLVLECNIARDIPPITADATRLRQVMLNLVSNAIKFTPAPGRVTVSAHAAADGLHILVRDTGIGMAAEDIPRALEPFGQISNTMTRTREGTGLGLPLARNLVELHGGRFEIASAPGAGTTITIVLPPMSEEDGEASGGEPLRQRSAQ